MNEEFATPEGPNDLIIECEGCSNLIYVRGSSKGLTDPCPICGCLNKLQMTEPEKVTGRLMLKSPIIDMEKESLERGKVSLPDLPTKVQEALLWLQQHSWTFGFTIEKDDKNNDEGSKS